MPGRYPAWRQALTFITLCWPQLSAAEPRGTPDAPLTAWLSLGRLGAALLLVLAVFFCCAWLLRQFQNPAARSTGMRVVSVLSVGHRERLLIVQIGEQQLLLGVTAQAIRTLHVLDRAVSVDPPAVPGFASQLGKALRRQETV